MRSNIPLIAKFAYSRYDPDFVARAQAMKTSVIIGGENYGQGSSREHAAITPMYLGVKAVIAKSIARIHRNNLINHGVVPLIFDDPADYDKLALADQLEVEDWPGQIKSKSVTVKNLTRGTDFKASLPLSGDEIKILLCGGLLAKIKGTIAQ